MIMVIISAILTVIITVFATLWVLCFYCSSNDIVIAVIKRNKNYDKYPVLVNKNAIYEHVDKFDWGNYKEVTLPNLIRFILQERI